MFRDRKDAGRQLAESLQIYRQDNPQILAIPRGGIEIGYHVAGELDAPLEAIVVRKLPLPENPEAGFGAIAEDGSVFLFEHMTAALADGTPERIIEEQKKEVQRRIQVLRRGRPLPAMRGKAVIIVDDGIAMGSTIRAAITMCRANQAGRIIVGAPVASPSVTEELKDLADHVVILERPALFRAVAQVYENWYDVPDEEAVNLLEDFRQKRA